jgi:hypothetical protein
MKKIKSTPTPLEYPNVRHILEPNKCFGISQMFRNIENVLQTIQMF